jgi:hypothetical protein
MLGKLTQPRQASKSLRPSHVHTKLKFFLRVLGSMVLRAKNIGRSDFQISWPSICMQLATHPLVHGCGSDEALFQLVLDVTTMLFNHYVDPDLPIGVDYLNDPSSGLPDEWKSLLRRLLNTRPSAPNYNYMYVSRMQQNHRIHAPAATIDSPSLRLVPALNSGLFAPWQLVDGCSGLSTYGTAIDFAMLQAEPTKDVQNDHKRQFVLGLNRQLV